MSIADDLQTIAERSNRDLDSAHDFFVHSQTVWQSFQLLVSSGHTISTVNAVTGTAIDEAGLLRLAPHYAHHYLATFTFRQFVATFESFFFAFFHRLLQHNPWSYGKSQLDLDTVLKARDRDEVIAGVLLKQLNELKYGKIRDWFDALNKAVKLDCPADDDVDALTEIKATRDILEHNAGVVNDLYLRKAGKRARYVAGERIEINEEYHLASWLLIKKVVADLTAAAVSRLGTA